MKKIVVLIIITLVFLAYAGSPMPGYAMTNDQTSAIQELLDEACGKSGVPGMSLAILAGDEVRYFSSGYADRENGIPADENTLYELASVSKAFTGLAMLLLEEQGRLSMSDSVQEYLPWFTLRYQKKPVDMQSLTLDSFLHHSSGLVNSRHSLLIPQGDTPDMLQKTVEALVNSELAFAPGERYEYGTVNYDVLGLVIEAVSGQSYEDFMKEQIFIPLGLHRTYLYKEEAQATGQFAQGYRTTFFRTIPYDAPDFAGNKPAGYVISCTDDMARWIGIQMGIISDIPEIFYTIIERSHQGNTSVPAVDGMYYAAGWEVSADRTIVEHAGGNPNFATKVMMLPDERTAFCLLTNGEHTNIDLVINVKEILEGSHVQSYTINGTQLLDIIMSSATICCLALAAVLFSFGFHRRRMTANRLPAAKRIRLTAALLTLFVAVGLVCWLFPGFFGGSWPAFFVWITYSVFTAFIAFAVLAASIIWYKHMPAPISHRSEFTT